MDQIIRERKINGLEYVWKCHGEIFLNQGFLFSPMVFHQAIEELSRFIWNIKYDKKTTWCKSHNCALHYTFIVCLLCPYAWDGFWTWVGYFSLNYQYFLHCFRDGGKPLEICYFTQICQGWCYSYDFGSLSLSVNVDCKMIKVHGIFLKTNYYFIND